MGVGSCRRQAIDFAALIKTNQTDPTKNCNPFHVRHNQGCKGPCIFGKKKGGWLKVKNQWQCKIVWILRPLPYGIMWKKWEVPWEYCQWFFLPGGQLCFLRTLLFSGNGFVGCIGHFLVLFFWNEKSLSEKIVWEREKKGWWKMSGREKWKDYEVWRNEWVVYSPPSFCHSCFGHANSSIQLCNLCFFFFPWFVSCCNCNQFPTLKLKKEYSIEVILSSRLEKKRN